MHKLVTALGLAAALTAGPTLAAEDHGGGAMTMTPAQMHEHCQAMMGHEMADKTHDHAPDKPGPAQAEPDPAHHPDMAAARARCAAMMSDKPEAPAKAAPPEHDHDHR